MMAMNPPPLNVTSMLLWHPRIEREPDPRQGELSLDAADRCENESDLGATYAREPPALGAGGR